MRERKFNGLDMQRINFHVIIYMSVPYFMSYNHYPSYKTSFLHKNDIRGPGPSPQWTGHAQLRGPRPGPGAGGRAPADTGTRGMLTAQLNRVH